MVLCNLRHPYEIDPPRGEARRNDIGNFISATIKVAFRLQALGQFIQVVVSSCRFPADREKVSSGTDSGERNPREQNLGNLSYLIQREIQMPLLTNLLRDFISEVGYDQAMAVANKTIQKDGMKAGRIMAEKYMAETASQTFLGSLERCGRKKRLWSLKFWKKQKNDYVST